MSGDNTNWAFNPPPFLKKIPDCKAWADLLECIFPGAAEQHVDHYSRN